MFLHELVSPAVASVILGPLALAQAASSAPAQPYRDHFVTVNDLQIHYLDWGANGKQPFVMLHGIEREAHSFDRIAPQFNSSYHVIAMDLRGHGDSDWSPQAAYLVEDMVKDLEGLADQLGLNNMILLGNSTGGRVAQVYAGLHPDRVAKLIVEDVGPERPESISNGLARRVQADANGWADEEELVAHLMNTDKAVSEERDRSRARFGTKQRSDGRLVWKRDPDLVKGFVQTELWRYVSNITCPAIYILGGSSSIVPPTTQERLKQTLPIIQIVVIPDAGHYPSIEHPDAFLEIARSFLESPA